jgi:hypothetical protein
MVCLGGQVSNPNWSQGEQPPAESARTESPDGLEDPKEVVPLTGPIQWYLCYIYQYFI